MPRILYPAAAPSGHPEPGVQDVPGAYALLSQLGIQGDAQRRLASALLPELPGLLEEAVASERAARLEALTTFLAREAVVVSPVDVQMARVLAGRRAAILREFAAYTATQLADAFRSRSANRYALAQQWKSRGRIFPVTIENPDRSGLVDLYLQFQFDEHGPLAAMAQVLDALEHPPGWEVALWMCAGCGYLPDAARPVDLLRDEPEQVIAAARREAQGSGA